MAENALVLQFVVELFKKTIDSKSDAACRAALQTFTNELLPWVSPADLALPPRHEFTMFERADITEDAMSRVTLSPESLALFRAWLRRQGIDPVLSSS